MNIAELLQQALALHTAGRLAEAEKLYQQVLAFEPEQPDALHLLGAMAQQLGQSETAVALIRRAIARYPNNPDMHKNLGVALLSLRRFAEAQTSFESVLQFNPADGDAWHQRATTLRAQTRLVEAEQSSREAVRLAPHHADAHDQLGLLLQARGEYVAAGECFQRTIALQPKHILARVHQGINHSAHGRWPEAQRCFDEALALQPNHVQALLALGSMLHDQGSSTQAAVAFQRAVTADPRHAGARSALGTVLEKLGRVDEAREQLRESLKLKPVDGVRLRLALLPHVIAPSIEALAIAREQTEAELTALEGQPLAIAHPIGEVGSTPFFFAYHGFDVRSLFERLARVYRRASPRLTYVAPHCVTPSRQSGQPIRVGIVSKFFHDHPIGKFYLDLLRQLDRGRFEVVALTMSHVDDAVSRSLPSAADRVVRLSPELWIARQQIADERLDALVYTDIGMDPWTYYLAFARLAPVQCVLPGHPVTSGIDTLDYFISSRLMEPEESESHYSERLVALNSLPSCMVRPQLTSPPRTRGELGLPAEGHLYLSAQTVYKYHPAFDELFARILRADSQGRLVLFAGRLDEWTSLFKQRLQRAMPDVFDRVTFVSRLSHADYLHALTLADSILDTPAFNGGTTSVDAVAVGAPVVTLPGPFMRMRTTLGVYNAIGVHDLVARDADEYVQLALRLANDQPWRDQVREKILAASDKLFENHRFVEEFQAFLVAACKSSSS